jgi:hypothetical protein
MSAQFRVVCGKCWSDIAIIAERHGELAMCPMCGQRDDLEQAQRIAGEHFLRQMIPDLQSGIADIVRGDEVVTFSARRQPGGTFSWHAAPLNDNDG